MPCRVLIAEDDTNFSSLLAFVLERQGYLVDTAEDGLKTVDLLNANHYNFVLLDYHIPGLNGAQVAAQVRQQSTARGGAGAQHVIAITGDPAGLRTKLDGKSGAHDDFQAILSKPLDMKALDQAIGALKQTHCIGENDVQSFIEPSSKRINVQVFPSLKAEALLAHLPRMMSSAGPAFQAIVLMPGFVLQEVLHFRSRTDHHLLPIIDLSGACDDIGVDFSEHGVGSDTPLRLEQLIENFYHKRMDIPIARRQALDEETRLLTYLYVRGCGLQTVCKPTKAEVYTFSDFVPVAAPRDVAERVAERGLLRRRFVDRIHVCSSCGSARTNVREECSSCRSSNITTENIVHHFACAFQGPPSDFRQADGSMKCPKCETKLLHYGTDYDRPGKIHICGDCGHKGSELLVGFRCFDCGGHYDGDVMPAITHYSYELSDQAVNLIESPEIADIVLGQLYGKLLPLRISQEILSLSQAEAQKTPFIIGEIYYAKEHEITQNSGVHGFMAIREIVKERFSSFAGHDGIVVSGRDFDYFLIRNMSTREFVRNESDLKSWCQNLLDDDAGLEFRSYDGAGFLLPDIHS